jgi:hypothetical protein
MEKNKVKIGMTVAVNKCKDGQLYRVAKKSPCGFGVELEYFEAGRWYNGGVLDICYLEKPSKAQLENHIDKLHSGLKKLDRVK